MDNGTESANETGGEPSDEEMRKLLKPKVTADEVTALLEKHYVSESQEVKVLRELDSYDDVNYMVSLGETSYLFKIHNGVESRDYLDVVKEADGEFYRKGAMKSVIQLQTAIMYNLKRNDVSTSVPIKPVRPNQGSKTPPLIVSELPVVSKGHCPCRLVCRLFSWVQGRPMSAIELLPAETLADCGRFLGRLDGALDHMVSEANGITALRRGESRGLLDLGNRLILFQSRR